MTHTPGKKAKLHTQWPAHVRDEGGGGIYLVADNGRYIAHFFEPKRRNVYNALRIAALWNMAERLGLSTEEIESGNVEAKLKAAPDMLKMLLELQECVEYWSELLPLGIVDRLNETIRKARGEE